MRINGDWHQLTDFLQQLLQYRCTLYLAILKWFGMQVLIHEVKLINNMMNKLFTCCAWVSHDTGKKSMFAICIWANVKLWEACADSTGWWFSRQDDYFHAQDLSDCCKGYDESLQLILETIKEQVKSSFGTHSSHLAAIQVDPSLRSPVCEILLRQVILMFLLYYSLLVFISSVKSVFYEEEAYWCSEPLSYEGVLWYLFCFPDNQTDHHTWKV